MRPRVALATGLRTVTSDQNRNTVIRRVREDKSLFVNRNFDKSLFNEDCTDPPNDWNIHYSMCVILRRKNIELTLSKFQLINSLLSTFLLLLLLLLLLVVKNRCYNVAINRRRFDEGRKTGEQIILRWQGAASIQRTKRYNSVGIGCYPLPLLRAWERFRAPVRPSIQPYFFYVCGERLSFAAPVIHGGCRDSDRRRS